MLEAYSNNQTILTNGYLPFTSASLVKGKTATLNGVSTIELNKSGVYEIILNIDALPSAAGNLIINMLKNNVIQQQAIINVPSVATNGISATVATLVSVRDDNSCKCNCLPTSLQFVNTGVGLEQAKVNVVITKIC